MIKEPIGTAERGSENPATQPNLFGSVSNSQVGSRVRKYFETSGFSRWTAIYGAGEIPPIWKVIRDGHQRALDNVVEVGQGGRPPHGARRRVRHREPRDLARG